MAENKIKITNRDSGTVGYALPDLGNSFFRSFEAGETKQIPYDELKMLAGTEVGLRMLEKYFIIEDKQVVEDLLGEVEPEYYYTEEEVKDLLENGTLEQLEDCLDFAPEGVIDLVKKVAVKIELNDMKKRKAIFAATGFNVNNAIQMNEFSQDDSTDTTTQKTRRVAVTETNTETKTTPRYKVVNK